MIASQLLVDREAVLRAVSWPVLVWEARPSDPSVALAFGDHTESSNRNRRPTAAEPLLLELRRRPSATSSGSEVTLGRMPDNDVVLEDVTVSRTHATFRREAHTGVWTVTDAGSHNGTFLDGVLIVPGRSMPLFDRARLRFGDVELTYFQQVGFEQYVRMRALRAPVRLTRAG
jgi:hypothetical protein